MTDEKLPLKEIMTMFNYRYVDYFKAALNQIIEHQGYLVVISPTELVPGQTMGDISDYSLVPIFEHPFVVMATATEHDYRQQMLLAESLGHEIHEWSTDQFFYKVVTD